MKWLWINGWGIPAQWTWEAVSVTWPAIEHFVVDAASSIVDRSVRFHDFDRVIGYSLGAALLLRMEWPPLQDQNPFLLAPFLAFPAEAAQGGRIHIAQLKYLRRWIKRDPLAALSDFYHQAGLPIPILRELPVPADVLLEGIEALLELEVRTEVPVTWAALAGEEDPLIDYAVLGPALSRLRLIPEVGHALGDLLPVLEQSLEHPDPSFSS